MVAFARASDAVSVASVVQGRLKSGVWLGPRLAVRLGLHLGEAAEREGITSARRSTLQLA
ncbi:MAG: hypothetical protein QOJ19_4759 [Acidimicrobiia bacterium]|nr:hypothetical protein [Acidimicrobiia bacterium]